MREEMETGDRMLWQKTLRVSKTRKASGAAGNNK